MTASSKKYSLRVLSKEARLFRVAKNVTFDAVEQFLVDLDCPRSLAVYLLWKHNEHDQLVELDTSPLNYNSVEAFRTAYAATSLLSKAKFLKLSTDRKGVALKKFFEFEDLCKQTNRRFRNLSSDPLFTGRNVWLLNAVKQKISRILGDIDVNEIIANSNWGPGVTLQIKGEHASAVNKFQYETGITRDLYSLLQETDLFSAYPLWQAHLHSRADWPTFWVGSVTVTVPKNAKTDRVISIEPGINLWFQKGIGLSIRRRLKKWGVDLNSQERNQYLAKVATIRGLATVDFSSASDSISLELVRELLPLDWFYLLNATRSHFGSLEGKSIKWEKFSSMGNGFTFELESLIFFAAASAVQELVSGINSVKSNISVFGDDVIIPSNLLDLYSSFCEFLGFKVNPSKSFSSGVFRESCGAHYYDGSDVKPVYLKTVLTNLSSVFKFANAVRRFAHRSCSLMACDIKYRSTFVHMTSVIPKSLRFRIPEGYGDGGFICNLDEATPSRVSTKFPFYEGYFVVHLTHTAVTRSSEEIGLLLARLRPLELINRVNTSDQEQGNNFALRGRTVGRVKRSTVPQWYNLGPWL